MKMNYRMYLSGLSLMFMLIISTFSIGQNMVTNPGFETYSSLPTGSGQWSKATGWSNVNGWIPFQWPYASPDYCHTAGSGAVKLPNTVFGSLNAFDGNAVMGLIMYYPSTLDFREYLATQLTSPMVIGSTYTISFYVTSGVPASIGGIGIEDFSVCLSAGSLTQVDHEPINATPQYTMGTPFFNTSWQLISFSIVASQAWDHITFGNFKNDANTTSQVFVATSSPGAYYFFDGVVVEPQIPLPVELLDFNAEAINNNAVELNWKTSSEINNDYFTIQRTRDGINWEDVSEVDGAGTSTTLSTYNEMDRDPYHGISYYRIKQTDFDGQFDYSAVRTVNIDEFGNSDILIYPNPSTYKITVEGSKSELNEIRIYSEVGQEVTFLTQIQNTGAKAVIDVSQLSSGMYTLKTRTAIHKICKL